MEQYSIGKTLVGRALRGTTTRRHPLFFTESRFSAKGFVSRESFSFVDQLIAAGTGGRQPSSMTSTGAYDDPLTTLLK